jgi:tripartite-type tricarboxylate transporter receptor subunit TctC
MKLARRRFSHLAAVPAALGVLAAILAIFSGHGAWAQTARPIKIVVPTAPGGVTDTLARLLAEQIGRAHGPAMVIENRPGAGQVIGTEAAARAAPDGNTVLMISNTFVINPQLRKVNYDALTSFEPICRLTRIQSVVAVNSVSPYRTFADLIDAARAKPGAVTLAGTQGGIGQMAFEMLKRAAGVNMTFVPYPGDAPAVNALLGEHVSSVLFTYAAVAAQVSAGRLRVLAIASHERIKLLPDVPTIAEFGYKDIDAETWYYVFAPARTPTERLAQLAGWFSTAVQWPEIKPKLAVLGHDPVGMCGTDFAAFLRKQYDDYGRIIREANIKAE